METEPSIWMRLFDFAWALLPYWWILAPGGIFALEPMMESFLKEGLLNRLNENWPKATRRRHFRLASIFAMFLACFLAFDDVSTKYRTSQRALNSAIGERDEARRQLAAGVKGGSPIAPSSRVEVAKIWTKRPDGKPNFIFQVRFENKSGTPADSLVSSISHFVSNEKLSQTQEDQLVKLVTDAAEKSPPKRASGNELNPGYGHTVSIEEHPITEEENKSLVDSKSMAYFAVVLSYYDDATPQGMIRRTEFCGFVNGSFEGFVPCHSHNRTYLAPL